MEVCKHTVDKNEIVGIGPLMLKTSGNQIAQLLNTRQLNFLLHLKQHSILIESEWFELDEMADRDGKNLARFKAFQKEYNQVSATIKEMIDERENGEPAINNKL